MWENATDLGCRGREGGREGGAAAGKAVEQTGGVVFKRRAGLKKRKEASCFQTEGKRRQSKDPPRCCVLTLCTTLF